MDARGNRVPVRCASPGHRPGFDWEVRAALQGDIFPIDRLNADTHMELSLGSSGQSVGSRRQKLSYGAGLAITPTYNTGHLELGSILLAEGRIEDARKAFELEALEYGQPGGLAMAYHALGRTADSAAALG